MNVFPHRSSLIRRQHKWWQPLKVLFSPQYSLRTLAFATFLIAVGSIAYIWQWINYLQVGYHTQALEKEKIHLEQQISLLEIEVNFLSRLERLDHIATTRMNMQPPSPQQRVILNPAGAHESE